MKRSLTLLLRIFVPRRRWGLGNRTVRHLAQCGGMWRCLSSTAQVVQMALALALMPTCAAMCSGAQDEASNSSRQLHARQPVAIIVAGAARVLAKSSVARESLHTFIRSNNGTPFFAIHLQDACSGAKFSIGGRFGSSSH